DLVLWIVDATAPAADLPAELGARSLRILNKIDAAGADVRVPADHAVSALTGAGLPELVTKLGEIVKETTSSGDAPAITQLRHRQQIEACLKALAAIQTPNTLAPEIAAEQLRLAADALGRIVGRIDPEDVLHQVFARFCIGK